MIALDGLSLDGLSVYWHGHPHAGYAFPLLHASQAAAIRLLGVDASVAYTNLTPAFAFFVPVAVYGAGRALANRPVAAAAAVFASWDILTRIIAGLVKQPPFFTFTVLFPAIIILLAMGYRHRQQRIWWWWTVIAAAEVAVLHPTYSVVLAPMLIAVALLWPRAWPMVAGAAVVTIAIDAWIYCRGDPRRGSHRRLPRHSRSVHQSRRTLAGKLGPGDPRPSSGASAGPVCGGRDPVSGALQPASGGCADGRDDGAGRDPGSRAPC